MSRHSSTGHGSLPQLTGNVNDVIISPLLQSCYQSSQALPQVYQHYGPSPIQPLSTEMQILLTVYYLVQLGQQAESHTNLSAAGLRAMQLSCLIMATRWRSNTIIR